MELTPPPSSSSSIRLSLFSPIAPLLDVWSKPEDNYPLSIEEDGVACIFTGGIVQDRGVLRGVVPRQFGASAAVDDAETDAEDEVDDELEFEEEDSDDELGHWSGDEDQSCSKALNPDAVARMQWLMEGADAKDNPRDKADLDSFLREERERQQTVSHDDGVDDGSTDHRASCTESDVKDDLDAASPLVDESDQDNPEGGNEDYDFASESEDELLLVDDSDAVEVDPVHPPPPSSPTPAPSPSKGRIRPYAQLYTPDRSQMFHRPRRVSSTSPSEKRPEPASANTRILSTTSKQSNAGPLQRPAQVMVVLPLCEVRSLSTVFGLVSSAVRRPRSASPSPSSSAEPPPQNHIDDSCRVQHNNKPHKNNTPSAATALSRKTPIPSASRPGASSSTPRTSSSSVLSSILSSLRKTPAPASPDTTTGEGRKGKRKARDDEFEYGEVLSPSPSPAPTPLPSPRKRKLSVELHVLESPAKRRCSSRAPAPPPPFAIPSSAAPFSTTEFTPTPAPGGAKFGAVKLMQVTLPSFLASPSMRAFQSLQQGLVVAPASLPSTGHRRVDPQRQSHHLDAHDSERERDTTTPTRPRSKSALRTPGSSSSGKARKRVSFLLRSGGGEGDGEE